ncbi:hypothetical protein N5V81_13970 [Escherichia coli]|nr:hypothetical protein [Escherichia coli]
MIALYSNDDQYRVKLITTMLDEAGNNAGPRKPSGTPGWRKMRIILPHHSFRELFKLRGQAFLMVSTPL